MEHCERLIFIGDEEGGTPCGKPAGNQFEGQWLCPEHLSLAERRSKQHWSEGFQIDEVGPEDD